MTIRDFLNLDVYYGFVFFPSILGLESQVAILLAGMI